MKTIYKYKTVIKDSFSIELPKGAEILTVQVDEKIICPCIWAVVETENEVEERFFRLYGTSHEMSNSSIKQKYIGTYQLNGFVGHLFEGK